MKNVMKVLTAILLVFLLTFPVIFMAEEERIKEYDGDDYLKFGGTNEYVTINSEYIYEETQFRGVWVSNFAGDANSFTTEAAFKKEMNSILDTMERFHMNALIFHVRTHNNALYNSNLNPKASYWTRVNFEKFDPLEWLINECHLRGIEFHAWMNPYRVKSSSNTYITGSYSSANPASNPDNLLKGNSVTILDPGKEVVKSFLINTCLELVSKYNVDAIHFDDYFYIDGCDDSKTYQENNPNGLSLADWRRENVNEFIRRLSTQLKAFNLRTGRAVQLGIAPSGQWKSGNGVVTYDSEGKSITTGSIGNGFSSYGDYLYADTKLWVDNGWIDYICPQCYHDMQGGGFLEITDWWNKVCKYSKVNLYIGMGYYGPSNSWGDPDELKNELYWMNKQDKIQGFALYCYRTLKQAASTSSNLKKTQMEKIYDEVFAKPANLPKLNRYEYEVETKELNPVVSKSENSYLITFEKLENAKYYVVYKDEVKLENFIKRTWGTIDNDTVTIEIDRSDFENIVIVPYSVNNSEATSFTVNLNQVKYKIDFIYNEEIIKTIMIAPGEQVDVTFDFDYDKYDVVLSKELKDVVSNDTIYITLKEKETKVNVKYLTSDGYTTTEFVLGDNLIDEILDFVPKISGKYVIEVAKIDDANYEVKYGEVLNITNYYDLDGNSIDEADISHYKYVREETKKSEKEIITNLYFEKLINLIVINSSGEELFNDYFEKDDEVTLSGLVTDNGSFFIGDKEVEKVVTSEDTVVTFIKEEIKEDPVEVDNKKGCNSSSIIHIFNMIAILGLAFVIRKRVR